MQTKRVWIFIIIFAVLAAVVLAVPIPKAALDDGGTREYAAMTYRIVKWKKFYAGGTYEKTKVYFGKDLKKTLDELWAEEAAGIEHVFYAEITEINGSVVTVRPAAGTAEAIQSENSVCTVWFVPLRARRKPQAAIEFNSTQAVLNGSDLMSGRLCR